MSQPAYVRAVNPIKLGTERRRDPDAPITNDERHQLRALIVAAFNMRRSILDRIFVAN